MIDFSEINTEYIELLLLHLGEYKRHYVKVTAKITTAYPQNYCVSLSNTKDINTIEADIILNLNRGKAYLKDDSLRYKLIETGWKTHFLSHRITKRVSIKDDETAEMSAIEIYTVLENIFGHNPFEPLNFYTELEYRYLNLFITRAKENILKMIIFVNKKYKAINEYVASVTRGDGSDNTNSLKLNRISKYITKVKKILKK